MQENALKEARKLANVSQREIASRVGISLRSYVMYENRERIPRMDVAKRIADTLHVPITDLF